MKTIPKNLTLIAGFLILMISACSSLDKLSTGQTDRLSNGSFYKTYDRKLMPRPNARIGYLPVTVQPNMDRSNFEYHASDPLLQEIAAVIDHKLDSLNLLVKLDDKSLLSHKRSPGIYVGSSEGNNVPSGASVQREDFEKYPPMIIYAGKPSTAWKKEAAAFVEEQDLDYILRVWVSFAQYPKADKGLVKKKVVLGTHYEKEIRFLTAIDKPVEVIQISGWLVDRNGNLVKGGAEGLLHSDTPFWAQIIGLEKMMDSQSISRIINEERRTDLPGEPLVIDTAMKNLVAQMTNKDL